MFFCGKSTKGKKQRNTNVIQSGIHSIDIIKIKPSCLKNEWGWGHPDIENDKEK